MNLKFSGLSDIGLIRQNNEDVWAAHPEHGLFALADGMGGHRAGEVAAQEAIDQFCNLMKQQSHPTNDPAKLRAAIEFANLRVYEKSQESEAFKGMGTTLCCLQWTHDAVIYAHVGDSRIYRYRQNKLEQLTNDHSLLAKWLAEGNSLTDPNKPAPYKNIITRSIGTTKKANPDIQITPHLPGDLFILCSDGLSDVLSHVDIELIIERCDCLDLMASRLIEKAKIKGSSDNITVLIVHFDGKNLFRQQLDDSAGPQGPGSHDGRA